MTDKKLVRIGLHGCDDTTYFDLKASVAEREFLEKLARLSEGASTYGCMPVLRVKEVTEDVTSGEATYRG